MVGRPYLCCLFIISKECGITRKLAHWALGTWPTSQPCCSSNKCMIFKNSTSLERDTNKLSADRCSNADDKAIRPRANLHVDYKMTSTEAFFNECHSHKKSKDSHTL